MENHKQIISKAARKGFLDHYRDQVASKTRYHKNLLGNALSTRSQNPIRYMVDKDSPGPVATIKRGIESGADHVYSKIIGAKNTGNYSKAKEVLDKLNADPTDKEIELKKEALKDRLAVVDDIRKNSPYHYHLNPLLDGPMTKKRLQRKMLRASLRSQTIPLTTAQKKEIAKLQAGK